MTKAQRARLDRIKAACEAVEDELNRLPAARPEDEEWWTVRDSFYEVIRHLKARWGELNAELNGGTDAER